MEDFFINWFQGLNEGLDNLSVAECARLFSPCASRCAQDALKCLYQQLFYDCGGNFDIFFSRLHELDGVDGAVIQAGTAYEIIFTHCGCDLHTQANVQTAKLCECSRQSILWVLKALAPNRAFSVQEEETILGGGEKCRFFIKVSEPIH